MTYKNAKSLISFLKSGLTPFHVTDNITNILKENGFKALDIKENFQVEAHKKYYVIKNDSAVIAFTTGDLKALKNGFKIIGAHTDSPSIKIKPQPEFKDEEKYLRLNTEVYGGPILNTWFDRPLTLAGRISCLKEGEIKNININFARPLMIIPNLAIHLNRKVNEGQKIDKQKELLPFIMTVDNDQKKEDYLLKLIAEKLVLKKEQILDFDLYLRDVEEPKIMGSKEEFLSAGQIDDLGMVHAGLQAFLKSSDNKFKLLALFDNEEIGSHTEVGADSPLLNNLLERIIYGLDGGREDYLQIIENSFMVSADMAHAFHPAYADKHDPTNKPIINSGLVIKVSSNRSYTTNSYSGAYIKKLCFENDIEYQIFVNNSNQKGGSTIGPLNVRQLGIESVDIGNPILSMHSIRELYGLDDHESAIQLMTAFYND